MLLLSGEGRRDIGYALNPAAKICSPEEWVPGPMGKIVDQLYALHAGHSAIENHAAYFVPEHKLTEHAKLISHPKLRGKNNNHFHRKNAIALASLAYTLSDSLDTKPIVVVFFHDCDGTQSSPTTRHSTLYDSINGEKGGFKIAGLCSGVPMIPRPKSEAWLLCAFKDPPYQHCAQLEDLPGNDASPQSAKKLLDDRIAELGEGGCRYDCDLCCECKININRIDMPSFNIFKADFLKAMSCNCHTWRIPIDHSLAAHLQPQA